MYCKSENQTQELVIQYDGDSLNKRYILSMLF